MCPKYYLLYSCYRYDLSIFQHIFGLLAQPPLTLLTVILPSRAPGRSRPLDRYHYSAL